MKKINQFHFLDLFKFLKALGIDVEISSLILLAHTFSVIKF